MRLVLDTHMLFLFAFPPTTGDAEAADAGSIQGGRLGHGRAHHEASGTRCIHASSHLGTVTLSDDHVTVGFSAILRTLAGVSRVAWA